jgi:hypothetical protein
VPLRLSELAANGHADTLAAVTLGAVVATLSGVVANMVEARARSRERERAAAVLVGEALAALRTILETAVQSMEVGERYGPVTQRILIAARGELDLYERNRELLLDLRDAQLRADLHSMMLRLAMPLDGVIASLNGGPVAGHPDARDQGMAFLADTVTKIPPLLERVGAVAGRKFDTYEDVFAPGAVAAAARIQGQR